MVLATLLASGTVALADSQPQPMPGAEGGTSAIVGGDAVPPGRWPDTVAVIGTSGTCTGTLIAPDIVLTAGHCAGIKPTHIIANTTDYALAGGIRINVAKTTPYPNWQATYDVSVIELVAPVTGVDPRKLGTACTFDTFEADTNVHLVGFGATDTSGVQANTQLMEAMAAVSDPSCMTNSGCNKTIAPGGEFIAGGTGTADSCFGDSGGPVYLDTANGPVVVGAVSRGVDNSATPCGGGGIYVRTDKIADWVEQTTGKEIAKDACDGAAYAADNADGAKSTDQVGCNAGGGGLGGGALLVGAGVIGRRRRRRLAAARASLKSAGQVWGETMLATLTEKHWS